MKRMMKVGVFSVFVLLFWLRASAFAGIPLDIYIHGDKYSGDSFVFKGQVYVEKDSALQALGFTSQFSLPKELLLQERGKTFVSLKDLSKFLNLTYHVNWITGIVDVYAPPVMGSFGGATVVESPNHPNPSHSHKVQPQMTPSEMYPPTSPYYDYYYGYYWYSPYISGTPVPIFRTAFSKSNVPQQINQRTSNSVVDFASTTQTHDFAKGSSH